MSEDILDRAEDVSHCIEVYGSQIPDNREVIMDLIAEVKRLRNPTNVLLRLENKLEKISADPLIVASTKRIEELEEQLAKWQAIAIEATAKAAYCNDNWNGDTKSPADEDFWRDSEDEATKATYREQAAKELSLEQEALAKIWGSKMNKIADPTE